ncbi:ribosomal protein 63, mitochondrial [Condylostylus longicornis]|uniref:ribosomal protein 63, mitochondrial n=1 Tax=Condylostylus longicornis TaxID=2530218 RepID=UPI00244DD981|nr:ribosomal protein 63, mitochondrial [Condylostylus longicornis]
MQLTLLQMFKKTVPGHIFRGKRRLVKKVTMSSIRELRKDYERQEANMLFLRNPYLSLEESNGHTKELHKREELIKVWNNRNTLAKLKTHITLEDKLNHLKVKDVWE